VAVLLAGTLVSGLGCGGSVDTLAPAITDCAAEHALVGAVTTLETRFHNVAGIVTVVDDCTVEISDFTFDGQGISVHAVLARDPDFDSFDIISEDLRPDGPYDTETLTLPLREGMTLDGVTHFSIWCVPAAASFGDGEFSAS
jgi:hypothetical protein